MGIETLAIASLVGSVVSGAVGFMGAQQQAGAQEASYKYQAQVARNNEVVASQNAAYASAAASNRAQAQDYKNRAVIGGLEAQMGASGLDLESGSSREVRDAARQIGRLDTQTIYSNALMEARGTQQQARNFGAQAGLDEFSASNASRAGTIAGISSLIGGASSFSDKWLRFQTRGVGGFAGT